MELLALVAIGLRAWAIEGLAEEALVALVAERQFCRSAADRMTDAITPDQKRAEKFGLLSKSLREE